MNNSRSLATTRNDKVFFSFFQNAKTGSVYTLRNGGGEAVCSFDNLAAAQTPHVNEKETNETTL